MNNQEKQDMAVVITTELEPGVGLPQEIAFNYEDLKKRLTAYVEKYTGLVVTEDEVAEGRRARAEVNAVIRQLTEAGRDVRKAWDAPLDQFLARVKELVGIAKPAEEAIAKQIKAFDEARREEKRNALVDDLAAMVSAEAVNEPEDIRKAWEASPHWRGCVKESMLTASASLNKSRAALAAEVKRCWEQVGVARRVYADKGAEWAERAVYALCRWDFDAATAFRDVDGQIAEAERIARRKAEAERRAAEAAKAPAPAPSPAPSPDPAPAAPPRPAPTPAPAPAPATAQAATPSAAPSGDTLTYVLRITGPRAALFELRAWMDAHGIKAERA